MLIRTSKLMQYIVDPRENIPWDCSRFTPDEVWYAYDHKKFRRIPGDLFDKSYKDFNIQRIAWFVKRMPFDPIELDVGCPSLGYYSNDWVIDGWHRIYAALLRKDKFINAMIAGEVDFYKSALL